MALRILVLGPIAPETLEALSRIELDAKILPPAEAHELLNRVVADAPDVVVAGAATLEGAGSSSLLHQILDSEFARAVRYRHPLALLVIAIDRVQALAATHGDAAIESWRRAFVETLRRSLRQIDVIARIGSDEIAVLLPETTASGARVVAERACALATRLIVKTPEVDVRRALPVKASVSVGVCDAPRDGLDSSRAFLEAARAAVARAASAGGERVELAPF